MSIHTCTGDEFSTAMDRSPPSLRSTPRCEDRHGPELAGEEAGGGQGRPANKLHGQVQIQAFALQPPCTPACHTDTQARHTPTTLPVFHLKDQDFREQKPCLQNHVT